MPNPSIPEMTPKSSSPNVVEWILVALTVVMLAGLGYVYFTLTQLSQSVTSTNIEVMAMKAEVMTVQSEIMAQKEVMEEEESSPALNEYARYDAWEVSFEYPRNFFVSSQSDSSTASDTAYITSAPGRLYEPGGVGGLPPNGTFALGYEMTIQKLPDVSDLAGEATFISTPYPNVKKIEGECDGVGCANAVYHFNQSGQGYYISIRTSSDYDGWESITGRIIASFE